MLFWPAIGVFSVGLLTRFLNLQENTVTFILIGAISMNTVQIAQLDLSYALLYSVWSKSLKHEFIAPIRLGHILLGCGFVGIIRGLLVFIIMGLLSVYLFDMNLRTPGLGGLVVFLLGMFLNSAIIGAAVLAWCSVRPAGRSRGWAFSYIMMILCGLYYPVSVLRERPGAGPIYSPHLFSGILPPFLRVPPGLQPPPPLRLRRKCAISHYQYVLVFLTLKSAYPRGTLLRLSE